MTRKGLLIAVIALFVFSFAPMASAQLANSEVSIDTVPANPGPDQSVTITLTSYSVDLQSAEIEWSQDGGNTVSGIGYDHYTIMTKDLGVPTTVTVTITPVGTLPIVQSIVITPTSVDILWQATDSLTPPFYRGKAMPTSESTVEFVAIPQVSASGALLSPDNFLYDWQQDYTDDQDNSGYGKDSVVYPMDDLDPTMHVGVSISSRDGSETATNGIDVSPSNVELLLYPTNSLDGALYETALSDGYTVKTSDVSLLAEPYFFSPGDPSSDQLSYTWQLNGNPLDTPPVPNVLFLHRDDTTQQGIAQIDLAISNVTKLFQDATASVTLNLQ